MPCCPSGGGVCGSLVYRGKSLPFLSGSINKNRELFVSQGIGYGKEAINRSEFNYSRGRTKVEGSFSIEVFSSGTYAESFKDLIRFALNPPCENLSGDSGGNGALVFSPAGGSTVKIPGDGGAAVISNLSLNGNQNGLVGCNFTFLSTNWDFGGSALGSWQFETAGTVDDGNPLPYYAVSVVLSGAGGDSVIINNYLTNWSININTNPNLIYTFCDVTSTEASKIQLGALDVTGTLEYWSPTGTFSETIGNGASLVIDLGSISLKSPHLAILNDNIPNSGNNSPVLRKIDFKCFASGDNPALYT